MSVSQCSEECDGSLLGVGNGVERSKVAEREDESASECSQLTDEEESDDEVSVQFESPDQAASEADSDEESEWDKDEYPALDLNYEAIKHVATYYLPGSHGKCTDITTLPRGSYHEMRILHFEDGWSCIGRFTRDKNEQLRAMESEFATVKYVRRHSGLPVPEIYLVNFNPNHAVGAAFTLMERIPGSHLYNIWDDLKLEHKKAVLKQLADVIVQLASLKFDVIGSLKIDGKNGALIEYCEDEHPTPRRSFVTTEEYLLSAMPSPGDCTDQMNELNHELKDELHKVADT